MATYYFEELTPDRVLRQGDTVIVHVMRPSEAAVDVLRFMDRRDWIARNQAPRSPRHQR